MLQATIPKNGIQIMQISLSYIVYAIGNEAVSKPQVSVKTISCKPFELIVEPPVSSGTKSTG